jgi:hypothetical protein
MRVQGQCSRAGRRMRRCTMAAALTLVVSILACGIASSAIPQANSTFARANQAYSRGDYPNAVRGYRAILAQQGYSAPVLFNLGNAWWRLNQPGRAVLNYERALRLAPGDEAIANTLRRVQQQAALPAIQSVPPSWRLGLVSLDALAWIGFAASLTLCAAVLVMRSKRSKARLSMRSTAIASAIVLVAAGVALVCSWPDLDRAVVLAAATPVHIAPALAADVSFQLKSGTLVHAGSRYDGYVMVHTDDGRSGWVSAQQVARIVTRTRDYEPLAADLLAARPTTSG